MKEAEVSAHSTRKKLCCALCVSSDVQRTAGHNLPLEREEDPKACVQSIDERDGLSIGEDTLVDDGAVGVERPLASNWAE